MHFYLSDLNLFTFFMANFTEINILIVIVSSHQSKRYICKMFPPMNNRQEKSKFVQDFPTSSSETVIFVGFQFHTYVVFYFVSFCLFICVTKVFSFCFGDSFWVC